MSEGHWVIAQDTDTDTTGHFYVKVARQYSFLLLPRIPEKEMACRSTAPSCEDTKLKHPPKKD